MRVSHTMRYGCSRLTLNAGSLLQFCQVPILLRPLFIPLKRARARRLTTGAL